MQPSRSDFLPVRGLRFHVRRWGAPDKPMLFLAHGWLDVSATFALAVQPLLERFQVLCPDARGFGHSQWPQDGYWFPDYIGDFEVIADHYSPTAPLLLAGHSMGAQIMSLYAGLRPERVARLACIDGLFMPDMPSELATKRFRHWLGELKQLPQQKSYPSFEELATRVKKQHPQLSDERALFIAHCWGNADGRGEITLLADPKHRMNGPGLFKVAESMNIWKNVTAPTLFLDAAKSWLHPLIKTEELQARRACFRDRREQVIEGSGHMIHFDAPEALGRALLQFFAE
jgi:pimeloyl-ACP methyl ester carboxylesterase